MAILVSLSLPSAHAPLNWGLHERMPYLLNTVAPTIARVVSVLLCPMFPTFVVP